MRWTLAALALRATTTYAFQPSAIPLTTRSKAAFSTQLRANVPKLTEPAKQLLDNVDVFIFDCDGVIWRVRSYCVLL